jgi:hypothetical protein
MTLTAEFASEAVTEFGGLGEEALNELRDYGRARFPVDSSAIQLLEYGADRTLSVIFADGSHYAIEDFPPLEFARWLSSGSNGGYWNRNLRGRY